RVNSMRCSRASGAKSRSRNSTISKPIPTRIRNLANDAAFADVRRELSDALDLHMMAINDNGFAPEGAAAEGHDESRVPDAYPLALPMRFGRRAARRARGESPLFVDHRAHDDEVVRYRAVMGLLMLGAQPAAARDAPDARFSVGCSMHVRI